MSKLFIVPILCIVLIAAGCGVGAQPGDSSQPSASVQASDNIPQDTASPGNSDQPVDTSSIAPDDTSSSAPGDTSTTGPTDTSTTPPDNTAQPTATSTPDATATATPGATATPSGTAGDSTTIQVKAITGKAQVSSYLSLRASASTTASTLEKIPNDSTLTILSVSTDTAWLKVKYSGKDGYVLAKYVQAGGSSTNKVCTVTSTTLNARSKASKTGKIIGVLAKGDTLIVMSVVTASSDIWYKVSVKGSYAYISSKYCRLSTGS